MTENIPATEPCPSLGEEIANSVSHAVGLLAALVAGPLLIAHAVGNDTAWGAVGASVFVAAIVAMYLASTLYHSLRQGHRVHGRNGVLCRQANSILPLCLALVRAVGNDVPLYRRVALRVLTVRRDFKLPHQTWLPRLP